MQNKHFDTFSFLQNSKSKRFATFLLLKHWKDAFSNFLHLKKHKTSILTHFRFYKIKKTSVLLLFCFESIEKNAFWNLENWYPIGDSSYVFSIDAQIFFCRGRTTMKVVPLECPHPDGPYKYPYLMYITHRKNFRAIWRKNLWKSVKKGLKRCKYSFFYTKTHCVFHGF